MSKPTIDIAAALSSAPPWLHGRTILLTLAGSHLYGLASEGSDVDLRGVCVAPKTYYLGVSQRFERHVFEGKIEGELECLRVFMRLAADGHQNALATLFAPDDAVLLETRHGLTLRGCAYHFLSQRMTRPFCGQARSVVARYPNRVTAKEVMHAVRLMRMLRESLTEGMVRVRRPDAAELLAIRNGDVPLSDAIGEVEAALANEAHLLRQTSLPKTPDMATIDDLCADILQDWMTLVTAGEHAAHGRRPTAYHEAAAPGADPHDAVCRPR